MPQGTGYTVSALDDKYCEAAVLVRTRGRMTMIVFEGGEIGRALVKCRVI